MRVLTVEPGPHFSVADVHRGWRRALRRLGCDVVNFNFEDRLEFYSQATFERDGEYQKALNGQQAILFAAKGIEVAAFEWWPDVVFITSCFFVSRFILEVLRDRGMKVVLLLTESPYEDAGQLERAAFADLVLLNDPTNLDRFRDINPNTHYSPHCYDPDIHYPRAADPERASDFCFVGSGFPSRINFLERINWSDIDVVLAGNWQALTQDSPLRSYVIHPVENCIDNTEAVAFYTSTKASANIYRRERLEGDTADGWALGPREIELAACGTFFLTEPRGENREILPMIPTFRGPEDFEEKLRYYLANEDERAAISQKAREAVADRTFDAAAARALSLL
jgi:spore maturation protein CgeB